MGSRLMVIRGEELRRLRAVGRAYRMRDRLARAWNSAGGWWTLVVVVAGVLAVAVGWGVA
jgi:hypothetical protein